MFGALTLGMSVFFLGYFYLHKVTKNQPHTGNKDQILTSPQPLAFDIPHTPLWSFLQQLLGRKECFLPCFLPLHLQVPNSLPGCSTYFSLGRPSSPQEKKKKKKSYKKTTTRKPSQTKKCFQN